MLLWVGVFPEMGNPGLPSARSNAITGLASLWSHCLARKGVWVKGGHVPVHTETGFYEWLAWVFTGKTFDSA